MPADSIQGIDPISADWVLVRGEDSSGLLGAGIAFLAQQSNLAAERVMVASERLRTVSDLLRLASNVVTELTTLQITVKESEDTFARPSETERAQVVRINAALKAYLDRLNAVLDPPVGTPGTRVIHEQENGQQVERNRYVPPISGVALPDLSFLHPSAQASDGSNSQPELDIRRHGGDEVAKMTRTFQTEINALNQGFQLESSDAQEANSLKLSFVEGLKSFVDKYFQVLSEVMRAM